MSFLKDADELSVDHFASREPVASFAECPCRMMHVLQPLRETAGERSPHDFENVRRDLSFGHYNRVSCVNHFPFLSLVHNRRSAHGAE